MTEGAALATEAGRTLKQALVEEAIEAVAWRGMRNLTMRAVSTEAGGTTAAIVHHYGSKSGLIAAAIKVAMQEEETLHAESAAKLKGHVLGHLNFVEWLSQYLLQRKTNTHAGFGRSFYFTPKRYRTRISRSPRGTRCARNSGPRSCRAKAVILRWALSDQRGRSFLMW